MQPPLSTQQAAKLQFFSETSFSASIVVFSEYHSKVRVRHEASLKCQLLLVTTIFSSL